MFAFHGPEDATHLVVLAPGDEGRLTDAAPTLLADALGAGGIRVVRFAFPDCRTEDGPVRDALLADRIRQAASVPSARLVLGGISRGARVSASLVAELGAVGFLGFAYPFHGRHDPDPGDRVARLASVPVPALICQGTRDALGNREQVRGYRLPSHIRLHWIEDANHALHPRPRSGHTQAEALAVAAAVCIDFVQSLG